MVAISTCWSLIPHHMVSMTNRIYPHTGFRSFLKFMTWFKPRYLLHGHIHLYRQDTITRTMVDETEVINVYPYKILDLEPVEST